MKTKNELYDFIMSIFIKYSNPEIHIKIYLDEDGNFDSMIEQSNYYTKDTIYIGEYDTFYYDDIEDCDEFLYELTDKIYEEYINLL